MAHIIFGPEPVYIIVLAMYALAFLVVSGNRSAQGLRVKATEVNGVRVAEIDDVTQNTRL